MTDLSNRSFGLLISYILPGFVALCGIALIASPVRDWLLGAGIDGPNVGGVFYMLIASVGTGMTASAVRWALIDTLHHATGLRRPAWDDSLLHERTAAYTWLVENHYRYYQFYGNTLIALILAWVLWRYSEFGTGSRLGVIDALFGFIMAVFAAGSRNALGLYYRRTHALLQGQKESTMTNGGHPTSKPKAASTEKPKSTDTQPPKAAKPTAATPSKS